MQQYKEGLELLSEQFSFSKDSEIIEMKKSLNSKLEQQNNLIESKLITKIFFIFFKYLKINFIFFLSNKIFRI